MATKTKKKKPARDVNQNVKRIFDEMIEHSEKPANRGKLVGVHKKSDSNS